ncbi:hypothetical protein [Lutibacter sp.]|uniref:tetratricopeptide repeat protein n=1 Tax=Lutibacter sp. TaxID=1925666 RepID=UPI0025B8C986|nr:hypothetical protein [Lutibacter sp.]MCF6167094.1 hypothetical protein [Lutibacter sp.]
MVIALQYINKPEDVSSIFNEISTKRMDVENCVYCEYRIYVKALADIELKNYTSAIELLEKITRKLSENYLRKPLFSAYIRSKNSKKVDDLIQKLSLLIPIKDMQELYLHIGKEYLRLGLQVKATFYFEKLIDTFKNNSENENLSLAYFYNQDYTNAEVYVSKILKKDTSNIGLLSKLASSQFKNGKIAASKETIAKLKFLKKDYQYGSIDYALAQYFAILKNKKKVIEHLLKSVSQGHLFTTLSYQNDPLFAAYYEDESFKKIINFWH